MGIISGSGSFSGSIWGSFQGWGSFRGRDHFGGCTALPTVLSKPHERGRVWVGPLSSVDVTLLDMYYHGIHILEPSITSTERKGPTHARPLSCGFGSSVGRALHR